MSEKVTNSTASYIMPAIKGVISGALSGAILSLISAAVSYNAPDPDLLVKPLALASLFLSSLICGIVASVCAGRKPFPALISGATFILLTTVISFIISDGEFSGASWFLFRLAAIAVSFVGGIIMSFLSSGGKKHKSSGSKRRKNIRRRR